MVIIIVFVYTKVIYDDIIYIYIIYIFRKASLFSLLS